MLPELDRRLRENWASLASGERAPPDVKYLGIPGSIEGGTATFLAFPKRSRRPCFVVKVHRAADAEARARAEAEVLRELAAFPSIASTVPSILACENVRGTWCLVESYVEGRPLEPRIDDAGEPDLDSTRVDLDMVEAWLLAIHRASASVEGAEERAQGAVHDVDTALARFPWSPAAQEALRQLRVAIPRLSGLPSSVQHGDLCFQNILVDGRGAHRRMVVIDWTDARPRGLPLHDLFFFIVSYQTLTRTRTALPGFLEAFDRLAGDAPHARLARALIERHMAALGIPRTEAEPLFLLFLLRQALFESEKLQRTATLHGLPRGVIALAAERGTSFEDATKQQVWTHLLERYLTRPGGFIPR